MTTSAPIIGAVPPRFMTDDQLRDHFGLTERAFLRLRATRDFPRRDPLVNKTDRRAVDAYFDRRAKISSFVANGNNAVDPEQEENFDV
ncbi:hypothetical protein [Aquibium microcysteis]|uniref:hypothetical protein n=1 Tax=Aquibium microcysteis TaxID=675281 RepID=UPI00165D02D1|nr:hypothetical protein [Aquibium microcysteis]